PKSAPKFVQRAKLRMRAPTKPNDQLPTVYGFRSKRRKDGSWTSHEKGELAEGKIIGPLPEGQGQFVGMPVTGAAVQKGFSGGGIYDPEQDAVVGMIVTADKDTGKKIAQFIRVPTLREALGRDPDPPLNV